MRCPCPHWKEWLRAHHRPPWSRSLSRAFLLTNGWVCVVPPTRACPHVCLIDLTGQGRFLVQVTLVQFPRWTNLLSRVVLARVRSSILLHPTRLLRQAVRKDASQLHADCRSWWMHRSTHPRRNSLGRGRPVSFVTLRFLRSRWGSGSPFQASLSIEDLRRDRRTEESNRRPLSSE